MPQGARILSVQDQRGRLCIWAQVDDSKPKVARHFQIVDTGDPRTDMHRLTFIGSVQQGPFVWHVFEITS